MTDRGSLTQRGFFGSLFDLSFTSLVATKIIKVLHVLGLIAIVVSALLLALSAFRVNGALGRSRAVHRRPTLIAPVGGLHPGRSGAVHGGLSDRADPSELVAQGRRDAVSGR